MVTGGMGVTAGVVGVDPGGTSPLADDSTEVTAAEVEGVGAGSAQSSS